MLRRLILVVFVCLGVTLSAQAAQVPSAVVGQNISDLLKGQKIDFSRVVDGGCSAPVLETVYGDGDQIVAAVYKLAGQPSGIQVAVFSEDSPDAVAVYVADNLGKIVRIIDDPSSIDDPCSLF